MNQYVVTSKTSGSGGDVGRFAYDNFIVVWGFMRQEFKLKGFEKILLAIESGIDTSAFATKEQLGETDQALDAIIEMQINLTGGDFK